MSGSPVALCIDLEATCWKGPPPKGQHSDIIEIGYTLVTFGDHPAVGDTGSFFVRPQRSHVSAFCTELTSITPAMVLEAPSLLEVCHGIQESLGSATLPWFSWGNYDRKMLQQCCKELGVPYPMGEAHFNMKTLYRLLLGMRKELGLQAAAAKEGVVYVGPPHRGYADAHVLAKIVCHVLGEGGR